MSPAPIDINEPMADTVTLPPWVADNIFWATIKPLPRALWSDDEVLEFRRRFISRGHLRSDDYDRGEHGWFETWCQQDFNRYRFVKINRMAVPRMERHSPVDGLPRAAVERRDFFLAFVAEASGAFRCISEAGSLRDLVRILHPPPKPIPEPPPPRLSLARRAIRKLRRLSGL